MGTAHCILALMGGLKKAFNSDCLQYLLESKQPRAQRVLFLFHLLITIQFSLKTVASLIFPCIPKPHSTPHHTSLELLLLAEEERGRKKRFFFSPLCHSMHSHTERGNSHKLAQKYPRLWEMFGDFTVGRSCRANLGLRIMTALSSDHEEVRRSTRVAH